MAACAIEIGERFGERDLAAFARTGLGLMDEAMLAALSGELSPTITGLIYCSLIVPAANESSRSTARARGRRRSRTGGKPNRSWWCSRARAWCTVRELMQLDGAWNEAIDEARRATSSLHCTVERSSAADAFYQAGEIHRLRGEAAAAEAAYTRSSQLGREPQPGLSLLPLAQGRSDAAAQTMRRVLANTQDTLGRAPQLRAGARSATPRARKHTQHWLTRPRSEQLRTRRSRSVACSDHCRRGSTRYSHERAREAFGMDTPRLLLRRDRTHHGSCDVLSRYVRLSKPARVASTPAARHPPRASERRALLVL